MTTTLSILAQVIELCETCEQLGEAQILSLKLFIHKELGMSSSIKSSIIQLLLDCRPLLRHSKLKKLHYFVSKCKRDENENKEESLSLLESSVSNDVYIHIGLFLSLKQCVVNLGNCNRNLFIMTQNRAFFQQRKECNTLTLTYKIIEIIVENNCEMIAFHKAKTLAFEPELSIIKDCTICKKNTTKRIYPPCIFSKLMDKVTDTIIIPTKKDKHRKKDTNNQLKWIKHLLSNIECLQLSPHWLCIIKHIPLKLLLLSPKTYNDQMSSSMDGSIMNRPISITASSIGSDTSSYNNRNVNDSRMIKYICSSKNKEIEAHLFEVFCNIYNYYYSTDQLKIEHLRPIRTIMPRLSDTRVEIGYHGRVKHSSAHSVGNSYLKLHGNYQIIRLDVDRSDVYSLTSIKDFVNLFHNNLQEIQFVGTNKPRNENISGSSILFDERMSLILDAYSQVDNNQKIDSFKNMIKREFNDINQFKPVSSPNLNFVATYAIDHGRPFIEKIKFPFTKFFNQKKLMQLFELSLHNYISKSALESCIFDVK